MYRVFNIAAFGVAGALFCLCGGTAIAGPKLICEEPSYNFGEREVGESVEHTFIVKNVGDAPADVKKFKPQCGCAVLRVAQDKLAPGAEAAMTLKVALGGQRGPFRKSLAIVSEDDKQDALTLTFEGTVESTLYVMPDRLEFGQVDADKEATRSVIVAFAQEEPVKVTKIVSDMDSIIPEVKTLRDGGIYRVTVRVKPPQGNARIQARVCLYTDSAKHRIVDIPVTASVMVDLAATPSDIILAGDPEQSVTRYVVIQSPKGKPFEIKSVHCPTASVKAEVEPMGDAGYRVEISGLTATRELDGKSLLVKTNVSSVPIIRIPLHVRRPTASQAEAQVQTQSGSPTQ